jgi:hypothetical protein
MKLKLAMLTGCLTALLGSTPLAVAHDGHPVGDSNEVFKINKSGEVKLAGETRFGSVTIKKGKYLVEHRIDGSGHTFIFTSTDKPKKVLEAVSPEPIPVHSRVLASPGPVKSSGVYVHYEKKIYRVLKIEIAGENAAHVF